MVQHEANFELFAAIEKHIFVFVLSGLNHNPSTPAQCISGTLKDCRHQRDDNVQYLQLNGLFEAQSVSRDRTIWAPPAPGPARGGRGAGGGRAALDVRHLPTPPLRNVLSIARIIDEEKERVGEETGRRMKIKRYTISSSQLSLRTVHKHRRRRRGGVHAPRNKNVRRLAPGLNPLAEFNNRYLGLPPRGVLIPPLNSELRPALGVIFKE
ncbi:hypothetical protein EVAR_51010_1 [Eumeta japonica]|uniref:Uncharacterized protein n=1 Tax=Eumeta variegata TaxID=151549 RepID=A0A4C1Y3E4_EUMVA|nr:hypothetical protein EVAR_51010_1 [Eumeta japonica]